MARLIELSFSTSLAAPAAVVWRHACSMAGVNEELAPWVRMTYPSETAQLSPDRVPLGLVAFHSWLLAFGALPFDRHALVLTEVEDRGGHGGAFVEQSSSWVQRRWRHERTVDATGQGCVLTDRLVVEPRLPLGRVIGPVVAALFRHRHRRVASLFGEVMPGEVDASGAPVRSARRPEVDDGTSTGGTVSDEGARGDLRWGTTPALLAAAAAEHGDREAVVDRSVDPPVRLSFVELREHARAVAAALIDAGIERGDRVAIWAPNCWEWVAALFGLQSAGAVLVPLNTRYKGVEAADILRRSRARALFTVEGFLDNDYVSMLREPSAGDLPDLELVVLLRDTGTRPDGVVTLEELVGAVRADDGTVDTSTVDARVVSLDPSAVSDLIFTSGTTGRPKGVVQSHGQSLRAASDWADIVGLRADDRYLCINPFFHTFGYKAGILTALMSGCTLLPMATFDLDALPGVIAEERITMIPGPPTIYQSLLNHPGFDPEAVDTLRLAVTGAAVVPVELVERMRDTLGFETVVTAYGLTECCGFATICRREDDPRTIARTCGRAFPGVEVAIVDDDRRPLPPGTPGEVVVRGYNVMQEYFEDPEQTGTAIDPEGWLHTGDIGVMDEAGYLRITDRKKDMFIVGGFNAYPAEIERLLLTHPAIAQAAVVGVPDDRMGEVGHAFVIPAAGRTVDADEVVSWAREHMANFKVPRRVEVVDTLPLNASGKVLKFELRERALAAGTPGTDR